MEPEKKVTKADCLEGIDMMIEYVENMPKSSMLTPITHYDYHSLLLLLKSILLLED
jgi:hypothetical protein